VKGLWKMKNRFVVSLLLVCAGSAAAAPVLTITPGPAALATPGQFTGWGFTLTSDPVEWITVTTSFLIGETNPSIGFYGDIIGGWGGPSAGVLAPGDPDWSQPYDLLSFTGLGYYFVYASTPLGSLNSGSIRVLYERYSADPNTCVSCWVGSGELDAPFSVLADVPEPSTMWFLIAGIAGIAWGRMLRGK
jgi:hypothetical protein